MPSVGDRISGSIFIKPGDDLDVANIKQLDVKINYNGGLLKIVSGSLQPGSLVEGRFIINNLVIKDNPGEISFTLDTIDGIPNQYFSGARNIKISF